MKEQELRERMAVGEENWWEELQTIAEEPKEEENQAWAVQAVEKLEEALKELLVCRFQEAPELARVSLLESRRFEDCMEYLKREVGKLLSHKSGAVKDRVVLEIMEIEIPTASLAMAVRRARVFATTQDRSIELRLKGDRITLKLSWETTRKRWRRPRENRVRKK